MLHPDRYCSIILNGADKSVYGLPKVIVKKKQSRGNDLKLKLIGIMDHGNPHRVRLFSMTEEHRTGSNRVVEALHTILDMRRMISPLSSELYVQVDSCTRENLN